MNSGPNDDKLYNQISFDKLKEKEKSCSSLKEMNVEPEDCAKEIMQKYKECPLSDDLNENNSLLAQQADKDRIIGGGGNSINDTKIGISDQDNTNLSINEGNNVHNKREFKESDIEDEKGNDKISKIKMCKKAEIINSFISNEDEAAHNYNKNLGLHLKESCVKKKMKLVESKDEINNISIKMEHESLNSIEIDSIIKIHNLISKNNKNIESMQISKKMKDEEINNEEIQRTISGNNQAHNDNEQKFNIKNKNEERDQQNSNLNDFISSQTSDSSFLSEPKPLLRGRIHQLAFLLTVILSVIYLFIAFFKGFKLEIIIYLAVQLILYGVSSTYHIKDFKTERMRRFFQRLDHSSIFLLISGTQTSVFLSLLPNTKFAASFLITTWSITLIGIIKVFIFSKIVEMVDVFIYIGHGICVVPFFNKLVMYLSIKDWLLILMGGVLYIVGGIIFGVRRPDPRPDIFGYHEIFHLLTVLANSCFMVPVFIRFVNNTF